MKYIFTLLLFVMQLSVRAQTIITVGNGTAQSLYGPIYIFNSTSPNTHSWNLSIYDQAEISLAGGYAGNLTGISWYKTDTGAYATPDGSFEIYIKNTTLNDFATAADFNVEVIGATLVYSSNTQTIPKSIGWLDFPFNTPFHWNGTDNIMILTRWVRIGNGTDEINWQSTATSPLIRTSHSFNLSATMGSLYTTANRPNIKLQIAPQAALDAGVLSLDSIRGRCAGTFDVYATIKNFGIDTITSVQVDWQIDGVTQTPYSYAGNLPANSTAQVLLGSTTLSVGVPHSYSAWTSNPNGALDSISSNDTSYIQNLLPGMSGLYTIGTSGADFTSFNSAVTALQNNGVCGPVEFSVSPGVYTERVIINEIPSASSVNDIVFHSSTNDSASVTLEWPSSAVTDSNYTLLLKGAKYITFQYLTFSRTGTDANCTVVEMSNGSGDIVFLNNRFIGPTNMTTANTSGTQSGIYNDGTSEWNNVVIHNNYFSGNSNGLWLNGFLNDYTTNLIVGENIFETYYVGAFILYQDAPIINKNICIRNNTGATIDYFAISLRYVSGAFQVNKNKITSYLGSYGIRFRSCIDTSIVRGRCENNFVQVGGTATGRGISVEDGSAGIDIFHNSINYTGTSPASGRAFFVDGAATSDLRILNNIFSNSGSGYASYVSANATAAIILSDNNCYYTTGSTLAFFGSDQPALANLQSASFQDAHSVNTNPNYTSTYDLHIPSGPLGDLGSSVAAVADDIDGEPRELIHPDIGADEFTIVGINVIDDQTSIQVYPNPANDRLMIQTNAPEIKFSIIDVSGRIVSDHTLRNSLNVIDVSDLSQGFYLVRMTWNEKERVERLVIR